MPFSSLLKHEQIAKVVAVALENWVARHPFHEAAAHLAQDELAKVLYRRFKRPRYEPYWATKKTG